jgi:peptide deformylase
MVLEIVKYGDPVLRTKGKPVDSADGRLARLAEDMIETMYAAQGLGLAAQQVGLPLQLTVLDVAQVQQDRPSTMSVNGVLVDLEEWMPLVLLNPELELAAERITSSEGCLSFPEIHGDVPRALAIKVRAQRLDGSELVFEATGMLARALQHEVDHLQGVLFIDRMNSAAKASLAGRLKRLQKEGAASPANGQTRPVKTPKKLEHSSKET